MAREAEAVTTSVILACGSCGENRQHHERIRGRVDTREEYLELVCAKCGNVTHSERTRAPVVHLHFDVTVELPERW